MDLQTAIAACREVRSSFSKIFTLPSHFKFAKEDSTLQSLLFLSAAGGGGNSLYSLELSSAGEGEKTWEKISSSGGVRQLSRAEQLLKERMRATGSGITHYEYQSDGDRLLVQDGPYCRLLDRSKASVLVDFPQFPGAVDYKLCPHCPSLLACVHEGDLWVLNETGRHQLTHTAANRKEEQLTAGQPSFIIQEEFDRYTGYWWQPTPDGDTYRILYEEVDERGVKEVCTFNPSTQGVEHYQYPLAGSKNTTSILKLLEFHFTSSGELVATTKSLPCTLSEWFPRSEYLTRAGWMPKGDSVWVQLLDRRQRCLQLAVIPVAAFTTHASPPPHPSPYLLWEDTLEHWINVTDILHFLSAKEDAPVRFIVASEATNFRHLYLIQATPPPLSTGEPPLLIPKATLSVQQLTTGDWIVFGSDLWVNEERGVVYFEGNASSSLEKHLYAVSLNGELPCATPTQLTRPGFYHTTTMDKSCSCFVSVYSSDDTTPSVSVYSVSPSLTTEWLCDVLKGPALPTSYVPPSHFSLTSESGEELHGVVYPPVGLEEGKKYPTVLYTYGGPVVQLVTREFSRHLPRIQAWVRHGFAVVMVDNRGSANRGTQFEAHIQGHMGGVELLDQVAGLKQAAEHVGYLDLKRVAITGWSYGGYMALMGLAKFPDVFKVAIAGAPVTNWLAYDTGYTERYLGVPPVDLKAYSLSSVLPYVSGLPTELNRLLVVHGLNDENVFFTHTSLLIDQLVALGKPYQLQVYTGERHGLRSPSSVLHCDGTVLSFLKQHL